MVKWSKSSTVKDKLEPFPNEDMDVDKSDDLYDCNDEHQERHGGARSHGRGEECGHGPNMIVYRKMEVILMSHWLHLFDFSAHCLVHCVVTDQT